MSGFGGAVKLTGESEYRKALKQIQVNLKEVSSEMKLVSAQYDKNDTSTEALKAKSEALAKTLSAQKSALASLETQYTKLSAEQVKNQQKHDALVAEYEKEQAELKRIGDELGTTSDEYKAQALVVANLAKDVDKSSQANTRNEQTLSGMRTEMNGLRTSIVGTESELEKVDNATEELADSTSDATKEAKKAGEGFTVFKGVLADLASSAIKKALDGVKQLGSKLVDVGKQALEAYSDFEQLTGGVETLFKESSKQVMEYANNAYKTAGMSANEYMSTVTSFSASLLQGLNGDTAKTAQIANQAIIDMSDNANKMGTSIEMIQNAYQGFAKQNYTMLDNLKLGYGGTQAEMLRLVKDAGVVNASVKSINDVSFDKIIEAIHIVQTNIGITGTTAKEAESTIEGSANAMKASWQNLLVAVSSDNGNLKKSIKEFTDSAEKYLKNLAPRVKTIVQGIFTTVKSLAKQYMPEVYKTVMPVLEKFGKALKDITTFIVKNFSTIAPIVMTAVTAFTALNAVLAISKTVTAVTTAMSALTAGVGLATKATTVFNAVLSSNPIMAVVTAVLALVTALTLFSSKAKDEAVEAFEEQKQAMQEQRDEIQQTVDSWNDLKDAQQKQIDAGMTEMSYYESLARELKQITDANGKVKEGYEERASFIMSQLNEALGMEIKMTDGVIENYTGIKNAIDELIKKKKAEIMLNAQEALYSEALTNRAEALRTLNTLEADLNEKKEAQEKVNENIAYWEQKALEYQQANDYANYQLAQQNLASYRSELESVNKDLGASQELYDQQKAVVDEYAYNIAIYQKNMEMAHQGHYDQMMDMNWNYVQDYQSAQDVHIATLQASIDNEKLNYDNLLELKKQSNSDLYDEQLKASDERITALQKEMNQYIATTEQANADVALVWDDSLDDQLSIMTGYNIEFKDAGGGLVQMYVDGVATGEPKSKSEMAEIVGETLKEISKQETGAKKAGEDLIEGVNKGVGAMAKQKSVFATVKNFGSNVLASLKASLKEQSPSKASKEMGLFLDEGVSLGVKDGAKSTLKTVAKFGQSVVDTLSNEMDVGEALTGMTSQIQDSIPSSLNASLTASGLPKGSLASTGGYATTALIEAFRTAMQGMEIEMGEDGFAQFVVKTISKEIYQ